MMTHPLFGPDPVQLTLVILQETGPGEYEGEWAAMGQVEKVKISLKEACEGMTFATRLTIANTNGEDCTVLQGEVDSVSGALHGSVCQRSEGGGEFRLSPVMPCHHRVELIDTDGDSLVFLRSCSGDVLAEYC